VGRRSSSTISGDERRHIPRVSRAPADDTGRRLVDVELPNDKEKAAQGMVLYAPRKVTLPPTNHRQSACRPCSGGTSGRRISGAHAVPRGFRPRNGAQQKKAEGVTFQLRPIYGYHSRHRSPRQSRGQGGAQQCSQGER
jgi:hypothetical protein